MRTRETALHIHMWRICNAERQTAVCGDGLASSNVQFSEYHAQTHTDTHTERDLPIAKRSGRLRMKAKSSVALDTTLWIEGSPGCASSACNAAPIINA